MGRRSTSPNGELRVIPGVWGHFAGGGANPVDIEYIDDVAQRTAGELTWPLNRSIAPPAAAAPEAASGVPLCRVRVRVLRHRALVRQRRAGSTAPAGLFVPVAFGTGALGMLVGGLWEFRNGNLFGATFGVGYACFLFTTPMILRWFAPEISRRGGVRRLLRRLPADVGRLHGVHDVRRLLREPAGVPGVPAAGDRLPAGRDREHRRARRAPRCCASPAGSGSLDGLCAWWVGFGLVLNGMGPKPVIPLIPYPYGK